MVGIEEEMIRAAIEASKQDSQIGQRNDAVSQPRVSGLEDPELAQAVSLSLRTAEQEKARQLRCEVGPSEPRVGGMSSLEHDEAVMLEAAMFGGIAEGSGYHVPYAPHQYMRNGLDENLGVYARPTPRPPSPSLIAQRSIREQQNEEYLAALQADREKELLEQSAKEAAMEEEKRMEEEARLKLEEQELERQLAAKEASLPQEPTSDDENAVNLVRMPDGSRRGRRFLRTDKLQYLFDFIDVARVFKPGTYRLVKPYPRRAFSDGESSLSLDELGLTSKQEALFLENMGSK
ncbi:plant UBX domain-containing protein 8 isoform X2 [Tanacetum coccineum]